MQDPLTPREREMCERAALTVPLDLEWGGKALSDKERRILDLFQGGLSHAEVAIEIDCPIGSVHSALTSCRRKGWIVRRIKARPHRVRSAA